jgi:hypothetical protein
MNKVLIFICDTSLYKNPTAWIIFDPTARKRIQKEKPLKFMQVLQQRSAVPSVFARANSSTRKPTGKNKLTPAEKSKLLQKAKRLRKGALNSYLDPKEGGSAVIEPRKSCGYNVWEAAESDDEALSKIVRSEEAIEYVVPIVKKPKVKVRMRLVFLEMFFKYANYNFENIYIRSSGTRIAPAV